ncbi:WxL domain-containing protein [Leuconostoc mesenteroides]|uniref:WxL domain-containing protein n=1 Tax=Leuconostoc mesenteroides TaxID=1245 RepID=UPI0007758232|nr:WxL domain-containing protein [Leuconostoc mesenteroides]
MINKKILGLAGLASLGLATTAPLAVVHADDTSKVSLQSNAQVSFIKDETTKPILNPLNPVNADGGQNSVTPIDNVTKDKPQAGTSGLLTIDFASSFNFGTNIIISSAKQTYYASAQSYSNKGTMTTGPNFAQVTDNRSGDKHTGWKLQVKQDGDFTAVTDSSSKLTGATISISNGKAVNGNGSDKVINTVDTNSITIGRENTTVMSADDGEGIGTWIYSMGNQNTADKSVSLTVPASSKIKEDTYKTTLTWTLSDTAVE